MTITTTYKTNHNGTGQILAKGAGRQRTVAYNDAHSPEWNHGNAAGELALALGLAWHDDIAHGYKSATVHTFKF